MKSLLLQIDTDTVPDIPFEEVMFMASLKTSLLTKVCHDIFLIEIQLTSTGVINEARNIAAVVKIESDGGEYIGYGNSTGWEGAMFKAFENILYQVKFVTSFPLRENIN